MKVEVSTRLRRRNAASKRGSGAGGGSRCSRPAVAGPLRTRVSLATRAGCGPGVKYAMQSIVSSMSHMERMVRNMNHKMEKTDQAVRGMHLGMLQQCDRVQRLSRRVISLERRVAPKAPAAACAQGSNGAQLPAPTRTSGPPGSPGAGCGAAARHRSCPAADAANGSPPCRLPEPAPCPRKTRSHPAAAPPPQRSTCCARGSGPRRTPARRRSTSAAPPPRASGCGSLALQSSLPRCAARAAASSTSCRAARPHSQGCPRRVTWGDVRSSTSCVGVCSGGGVRGQCPPGCCDDFADAMGRHLLMVAHEGRADDVRKLINAGAEVDYTNSSKWTALHRAAARAHPDVVALLLQCGADVRATTSYGYTPLHFAALNDFSGESVMYLLASGACADAWNRSGQTPLHLAARAGNLEGVAALVAAGASCTAKDDDGRTAFDVARTDCVLRLLASGADPVCAAAGYRACKALASRRK